MVDASRLSFVGSGLVLHCISFPRFGLQKWGFPAFTGLFSGRFYSFSLVSSIGKEGLGRQKPLRGTIHRFSLFLFISYWVSWGWLHFLRV